MADEQSNQSGLNSSETSNQAGLNSPASEATAGSNAGGDATKAFSDKLNAYREKADAEKADLQKQLDDALSKLNEVGRNALNADELREATKAAQEREKALSDKHLTYREGVSAYFDKRVEALPDDYKEIMAAVSIDDFDKYTATLARCEKLAGGEKKPDPQGGAQPSAQPSSLYSEFQEAKKRGDNKKLTELLGNPKTRREIESEALRMRK